MAERPTGKGHRLSRAGFFALGLVMLALGLVGALLPLMPTTIFLILAAWCFGRSSPALERRMLEHPRFGPVLRDWREHGVMPRRAKWMAYTGMAVGYVIFLMTGNPPTWLAVAVLAMLGASALWIVRRPEEARTADR